MNQPAPIVPVSYAEYVKGERLSSNKHEYVAGEVFAMASAKHGHNVIVVNGLGELRQALLEKPCFVWGSDMRVRTEDGVGTYPDISARCGTPSFSDDVEDELTNPTVIIEVLSPSTEASDRGEKFAHYRALSSLQMYLLVATNRRQVDGFTRQPDGAWLLRSYLAGERIALEPLGCELAVDALYLKVDLPDARR